jgi:hypothetical protein
VAELAAQEGCHPRTIWRDLAAIQAADLPLYSEKHGQKSRPAARESLSYLRRIEQTFHIGLKPLRKAVAEQLSVTAKKYSQRPVPMNKEDSERRMFSDAAQRGKCAFWFTKW